MKIIIDFLEANYKALKMGAERGLALSIEHRAILNGIVLDESQGMVYKINEITNRGAELRLVTTDKAKAEECVRRLNAISEFHLDKKYEIEEGEDDIISYAADNETFAIKAAKRWLESCNRDLAEREESLATLRALKEKLDPIMTNTDKAPKDMVPEMIKAIHGINLDVCVVEFLNHHELVMHYPDGTVRTDTGENYCTGSFLRVNGTQWRYMNKWDIDDDILHEEGGIRDITREINDTKKFLENNSVQQKGE